MPLSPALAAAFEYIADQVSNLNEVQFFDRTMARYTKDLRFGGRKFVFEKLGYSQLGTFAGIGYKIKFFKPDEVGVEKEWTIWVMNAVDAVAVNRRTVVAGIITIIKDPNAGKTAWTLDANQYASA
ncbi:hypothetical protein C8Q70DRAFT_1053945 [Cubamyces menziesii]|nr:hypothetical protein C8Q70DRAFT_1053945 [Cubamyces menziesii]